MTLKNKDGKELQQEYETGRNNVSEKGELIEVLRLDENFSIGLKRIAQACTGIGKDCEKYRLWIEYGMESFGPGHYKIGRSVGRIGVKKAREGDEKLRPLPIVEQVFFDLIMTMKKHVPIHFMLKEKANRVSQEIFDCSYEELMEKWNKFGS